MRLIITLDAGTTNSRAVLWKDDKILSEVRTPVGVRDTAITGNNETLARAVAGCLAGVCLKAGIAPEAVDLVVASGMITSGLGLKEIPHLAVPVGIEDMTGAMVSEHFPTIWHKPIWFIPGVKNKEGRIDVDDLPSMDMMRGEEVEVIGLLDRLNLHGPCWVVLPGSHTKLVRINKNGRMVQIISTLAGEMTDTLARNTILAASVDLQSELDETWLVKGGEATRAHGLNRALYCVRLAELWTDCTVAQRTSYLIGALLTSDIIGLKASAQTKDPIYITGRDELRKAFMALFSSDEDFKEIYEVKAEHSANLAGWGALLVAKKRGMNLV